MAGIKISNLPTVTPLTTDLVVLDRPAVGAGAPITGKATLADVQSVIGGTGGNDYWQSTTSGQIFATGTLASITGSLRASFLSASNGLQITGSFTHGTNTVASTSNSHAQGDSTTASGAYSHAEGAGSTASAPGSHAEGVLTIANAQGSHSEGYGATASGQYSHAEGESTTASGQGSHAEGYYTTATGSYSHAEGSGSIAFASASHAEGIFTIASGSGQLAIGKYNQRNNDFSLFVIGDGTGDSNSNRSDIVRVNSGTLPGSGSFEVTGTVRSTLGFSGSLTQLTDGRSYLVAGTNVTITSASDGQVTINSTGGGGGGDQFWGSSVSGSIFTTGSVSIGDYGTNKSLRVNGMNLTPYSGSQTITGSTISNVVILDLSGTLSNNQYGSFNVDVVASTKGITNMTQLAVSTWKLSVSMVKCGGNFEMVGVTELDGQRFAGGSSVDNPSQWYVDVNSFGSLYANTGGTLSNTSWGAIVTKQTVIDVNSGSLLG
jgi:hypothetical protein